MNVNPMVEETAQLNTIQLCRHYFEKHHFKPVQHAVVTNMCKRSVYALQEKRKFLQYIGKTTWPVELHIRLSGNFSRFKDCLEYSIQ